MAVIDWRAWVAQQGGMTPVTPVPTGLTGTYPVNQPFPGVGPIIGTLAAPGKGDLIDGTLSIPPYMNTPVTVNAIDPYYVGTYPSGGGWVAPMLLTTYPGGVAGLPGAGGVGAGSSVPAGPIPRPAIPGITSP